MRGKTELTVFKNEKLLFALSVFFKGQCFWPIDKCRYLGVFIQTELSKQHQLDKIISKLASLIKSLYLILNQKPLPAERIFSSILHFSLNFVLSCSCERINKQKNRKLKQKILFINYQIQ